MLKHSTTRSAKINQIKSARTMPSKSDVIMLQCDSESLDSLDHRKKLDARKRHVTPPPMEDPHDGWAIRIYGKSKHKDRQEMHYLRRPEDGHGYSSSRSSMNYDASSECSLASAAVSQQNVNQPAQIQPKKNRKQRQMVGEEQIVADGTSNEVEAEVDMLAKIDDSLAKPVKKMMRNLEMIPSNTSAKQGTQASAVKIEQSSELGPKVVKTNDDSALGGHLEKEMVSDVYLEALLAIEIRADEQKQDIKPKRSEKARAIVKEIPVESAEMKIQELCSDDAAFLDDMASLGPGKQHFQQQSKQSVADQLAKDTEKKGGPNDIKIYVDTSAIVLDDLKPASKWGPPPPIPPTPDPSIWGPPPPIPPTPTIMPILKIEDYDEELEKSNEKECSTNRPVDRPRSRSRRGSDLEDQLQVLQTLERCESKEVIPIEDRPRSWRGSSASLNPRSRRGSTANLASRSRKSSESGGQSSVETKSGSTKPLTREEEEEALEFEEGWEKGEHREFVKHKQKIKLRMTHELHDFFDDSKVPRVDQDAYFSSSKLSVKKDRERKSSEPNQIAYRTEHQDPNLIHRRSESIGIIPAVLRSRKSSAQSTTDGVSPPTGGDADVVGLIAEGRRIRQVSDASERTNKTSTTEDRSRINELIVTKMENRNSFLESKEEKQEAKEIKEDDLITALVASEQESSMPDSVFESPPDSRGFEGTLPDIDDVLKNMETTGAVKRQMIDETAQSQKNSILVESLNNDACIKVDKVDNQTKSSDKEKETKQKKVYRSTRSGAMAYLFNLKPLDVKSTPATSPVASPLTSPAMRRKSPKLPRKATGGNTILQNDIIPNKWGEDGGTLTISPYQNSTLHVSTTSIESQVTNAPFRIKAKAVSARKMVPDGPDPRLSTWQDEKDQKYEQYQYYKHQKLERLNQSCIQGQILDTSPPSSRYSSRSGSLCVSLVSTPVHSPLHSPKPKTQMLHPHQKKRQQQQQKQQPPIRQAVQEDIQVAQAVSLSLESAPLASSYDDHETSPPFTPSSKTAASKYSAQQGGLNAALHQQLQQKMAQHQRQQQQREKQELERQQRESQQKLDSKGASEENKTQVEPIKQEVGDIQIEATNESGKAAVDIDFDGKKEMRTLEMVPSTESIKPGTQASNVKIEQQLGDLGPIMVPATPADSQTDKTHTMRTPYSNQLSTQKELLSSPKGPLRRHSETTLGADEQKRIQLQMTGDASASMEYEIHEQGKEEMGEQEGDTPAKDQGSPRHRRGGSITKGAIELSVSPTAPGGSFEVKTLTKPEPNTNK